MTEKGQDVQAELTSLDGARAIEATFTDKSVTAFGALTETVQRALAAPIHRKRSTLLVTALACDAIPDGG